MPIESSNAHSLWRKPNHGAVEGTQDTIRIEQDDGDPELSRGADMYVKEMDAIPR